VRHDDTRRGLLVCACAFGLIAALVTVPRLPAATAATGWTVVPSVSRAAPASSSARLLSIACRTPTSCITAGRFDDPAQPSLPLVGRLTSTGWSFRTAPLPSTGNPFGELASIACATATKCFAVGDYWDGSNLQALVSRWDGHNWARIAAPQPGARSALTGISCPSTTRCFAVGSASGSTARRTLIVMWNGAGWKVLPSPTPHPHGPAVDDLSAIACTSANNCIAVGLSGDRYNAHDLASPLALRWDGKNWTVVPVPTPAGSEGHVQLAAIACASPTVCFATGTYHDNSLGRTTALIERWNGSTWSIVTSYPPKANRDSALTGISCPSANACFAIGGQTFSPFTTHATLFGRWSGNAWSFTKIPNTPFGVQQAISCATPSSCIAVGAALVQRWNGTTWSVMKTGASTGGLSAVSCAGDAMCVGVGTYSDFSTGAAARRGTIQQWNGTRFETVPVPAPSGATEFTFTSVGCPSATACFAVGARFDGSGTHPLVERWDGSSWTVSSIMAPTGAHGLSDISCPDVSTCFAIGDKGSAPTTFVERWNGSTWAVAPAPSGSAAVAISCSSAAACLAVRNFDQPSSWNGTAWTNIAAPDVPGDTDDALIDVSCLSATFCMGVGTSIEFNAGHDSALEALWNGSSWSVTTGPTSPNFAFGRLGSVACRSTTDCVAVGLSMNDYIDADFRPSRTLVEQWNGSTWSIVPSASPAIAGFPNSPVYDSLADVSCASSACLAVGTNANAMSTFSLAEKSP